MYDVVSPTSSDFQRALNESSWRSFGGTIWVTYPVSSRGKDSFLNPFEINDLEPKLEFELVIDWSAPSYAKKCWANPIAKTETSWINASFDALIW